MVIEAGPSWQGDRCGGGRLVERRILATSVAGVDQPGHIEVNQP
jgi:hypothetical protein